MENIDNKDLDKIHTIINNNLIKMNMNPSGGILRRGRIGEATNDYTIVRYSIDNGMPCSDFVYETKKMIVAKSGNPADNNTFILDPIKDHIHKIDTIKKLLFVELKCQLHLNKMKEVYSHYKHEDDDETLLKYKQRIMAYERFYNYAIENFLIYLNMIYYESMGIRSGIELKDAIKMAIIQYKHSLRGFEEAINNMYNDEGLINKFKSIYSY